MKVVPGLKSHSGWAAWVVVGAVENAFCIADRRRIELIDNGELWAKQPYHAAEMLEKNEACRTVKAGIDAAHLVAIHSR